MNENCFFCTNKKGSYFCDSNKDFSAYQGWFIFSEEPWDLYKIIDKISGKFNVEMSDKTLLLNGDVEQDFVLDLDFRGIHDFCDQGRIYDVYEKNNFLIVKYTKFSDNTLSKKLVTKYLAIKGLNSYNLLNEWFKKVYSYDLERKVRSDFFVFRLLEGNAIKLSFGIGSTEEDAIINALVVPFVEKQNKFNISKSIQTKLYDEEKDAILAVNNAFNSCVKENNKGDYLIFAGYPWFYQVWARDECISLIGLIVQENYSVAKNIILRNLKRITDVGILPNRYPESVLGSADSTGWLFHRIKILLDLDNKIFSSKELLLIENKLDMFLNNCKNNSYKGLVYNGPKETWMDTTDKDGLDTRDGARVEIQALYLSALNLKLDLRILNKDDNISKYKNMLKKKKSLMRAQLIKNKILYDGISNNVLDTTIRPNVFLAYYIYPELAMKHQWGATFDQVLLECWLEWGGLSSISKNHVLFKDTYSGIDNLSYHRGDSWFFVNNIVAISLNHFNSKKYKDKILKIKKASVNELLNSGFINYCAEVSSAKKLESKGSLSQAWSSATLLELLLNIN